MFFLLRAAFWLSLVVLLIPADPSETARPGAARSVSTFEAIGAAQSTFEDLRGFCSRNPNACETGKTALDGFGAKARTGARWVYEQLDGRERDTTGSTPSEAAAAPTNPAAAPAHAAATPAHGAPAASPPVPLRASIVPMPAPRPLS